MLLSAKVISITSRDVLHYAEASIVKGTDRILLLRAADYIDQHGWHQGSKSDDLGRVSLEGAVEAAEFGSVPNRDFCWPKETGFKKVIALRRIEKYLNCSNCEDWNDHPDRTQEQVVAALRAAAVDSSLT